MNTGKVGNYVLFKSIEQCGATVHVNEILALRVFPEWTVMEAQGLVEQHLCVVFVGSVGFHPHPTEISRVREGLALVLLWRQPGLAATCGKIMVIVSKRMRQMQR